MKQVKEVDNIEKESVPFKLEVPKRIKKKSCVRDLVQTFEKAIEMEEGQQDRFKEQEAMMPEEKPIRFGGFDCSQFCTGMAQVRICRALLAFVLFASVVTTAVTAQDSELAPSPSMDAGAAFPVTFSGGFVCSSLLFSIIALIFLHQ
ncbi:hypothetical protein EZV62_001812 [Acer yangbiense]|uniref:Transmembrane protein n=1 Tax=Acer yangbiense TaxID=1000413 RepID=A0A5C7IVG6_9ROSI|nr:hypothetical protein EZV62_001812 [Acer yangbiense]